MTGDRPFLTSAESAIEQLPRLTAQLKQTSPLTLNQWLFCLLVSSPMIVIATSVNRFDPTN